MKIVNDLQQWRIERKKLAHHNTIGFVPTMGNLHQGHASLYKRSLAENDVTVASIFVNPTQFNQSTDFENYPKSLEADFALLSSLGVDYCLLPDEKMMYPDAYRYQIHENQLSLTLEGKQRPGHFTGVLSVVMKLLNIVQANRAYFGEKDYQQYQLIKEMVSAFFMEVEILACPCHREPSKLPYSSRNNRLNPTEKKLAEQFARIFHSYQLPISDMIQAIEALGLSVEYIQEQDGRRFAAARVGEIRLIDNYLLDEQTANLS